MRVLLVFALAVVALAGCVPNKRIVYFQHKTEPKRGEVNNADTIVRSYTNRFTEYRLRPYDVISLNIASVTPQEFDFVKKYEEQLGLIRKLNQYDQYQKSGGGGNQRMAGGQATAGGGMSPIALDRIQTGFILNDSGYLELPYIGKLKLSGLTLPQVETFVKGKLKGYFETPVVRVQLLSFHFTIMGEVSKEGRFTVFDQNATIIDALAIADNLTDFADRSRIKIVRSFGNETQITYVDVLNEDLLGQPGFYLQPNDLIIVPPLQARASRKYTLPTYTTALSLISSSLTLVLFIITLNR